ncbi:MAG TPA: bifunctional phosphoribosylaminoimidazolecarboxamide formyltransferase/IMP cyclohydrolase [Xanthomonadales bacterium]|nr:bifunctional phosphoribosylaminoimidazolecarboxamide formyltransferase/IMP cyclohydrolase [Xanthomonadales bacterium]
MNEHTQAELRWALISVSDKTGLLELAQQLLELGFGLLSTGGTARAISDAGLAVTEVSDYTGFPEIMAGRVKTLHPRIHGGLLGRDGADDAVMQEQDIPRIALAIINLYPFEAVTAKAGCSLEEAIENIDIGGPAMVRSAAKNHASVGVVTSPDQYGRVLEQLKRGAGQLSDEFRFELAIAAFNRIAQYDAAIANYLSALEPAGGQLQFPRQLNNCYSKIMDLRYGENPHQQAAWYRDAGPAAKGLAQARQLQGKELSFNNIADADAAWAAASLFDAPACVIVKHANPCGVALAASSLEAYQRAFAADPTSAFGGVIAFNREVDGPCARALVAQQFVEVLLAPSFTSEALAALASKANVRVLQLPLNEPSQQQDLKRVAGGVLVQTADAHVLQQAECKVVSQRQPTAAEWNDLLFAWKVAQMVKSNAIVYARNGQTLGIGAGQMSRVDSARIARWKAADAKLDLNGAAMASDAFFPFRDGPDTAAEAGVSCVIHPGGSMRDDEVIAAADEHGLAMVFTGVRHFRH